jgi:hypothetical protein
MTDIPKVRFSRFFSDGWLFAPVSARKELYRAVKLVKDEQLLSWEEVYRSAFGKRADLGVDYEANFRHGRIARRRAYAINQWLVRENRVRAARLDDLVRKEPIRRILRGQVSYMLKQADLIERFLEERLERRKKVKEGHR